MAIPATMHVYVVASHMGYAVLTCVGYGNGDDGHLGPRGMTTVVGTLVEFREEYRVYMYGWTMVDNVGEGRFTQLKAATYGVQVLVIAGNDVVVEIDVVGKWAVAVRHALASWYPG